MREFDIIDSVSELRLRVFGSDLETLFRHALKGMFASMEPMIKDTVPRKRRITLTALDKEQLLVDFLSEALVFSDIDNLSFNDVVFHSLTEQALDATITGQAVLSFGLEIKAVTYHDVHIRSSQGQLICELLFDI
jgi:SHS2 domain-containing protein